MVSLAVPLSWPLPGSKGGGYDGMEVAVVAGMNLGKKEVSSMHSFVEGESEWVGRPT
jgi:hypothetical protein